MSAPSSSTYRRAVGVGRRRSMRIEEKLPAPASRVEEEEILVDTTSDVQQLHPPLEYHVNIRPHEDPRSSERKRTTTNAFVAGSTNSMVKKRKISISSVRSRNRRKGVKYASLKQPHSSTAYYRRNFRTPQTLRETIRDLTPPSVLVASTTTIHFNENTDDSSDTSQPKPPSHVRKRTMQMETAKSKPKKPAEAKEQDHSEGDDNGDNYNHTDTTATATTTTTTTSTTTTTTTTTATSIRKKKKKTKQPKPFQRKTKRCWRYIPCQECISCLRTSDCGKCGQCLRYMECILRQCITPVRDDRHIPKTVLSDDESLKSMESDVSDLEWTVAFPEETYGVLTPEDVWSWFKKDPDHPDT